MTDENASNSKSETEQAFDKISALKERAPRVGPETLEIFHQMGIQIRHLKEILPRGGFGKVIEARCGFGKQWRARLLSIEANWPDIQKALAWAEGQTEHLGSAIYSVDGSLRLLAAWRRGEASAGAATRKSGSSKLEQVRDELKLAKAGLLNARRRIADLEARACTCSRFTAQPLSSQDKEKVLKVDALWRRGIDGERLAAEARLRAIAARFGWDFDAFQREHGIGPVSWTKAHAA